MLGEPGAYSTGLSLFFVLYSCGRWVFAFIFGIA